MAKYNNFDRISLDGAEMRLGQELRPQGDKVFHQDRLTTIRRGELALDNLEITVSGGVGEYTIALFPNENIRLDSAAMSLTGPDGYQIGLGKGTEGDADLIPYTTIASGRVDAVSSGVNGLSFLASDTEITLLVSGADGTVTLDGLVHIAYVPLGEIDLSSSLGAQADVDAPTSAQLGDGGYEFTGAFVDRTTGQSGANDLGTNVEYTTQMAVDRTWLRFGFSSAQQVANDVEYWGETNPDFDQTKGLFGGLHMPPGVTQMFDFDDTALQAAVTTGDVKYTAAPGSYDFTQCRVGDLAKIRFSFNIVPQEANTTVEVGLIFATRDENDNVTFTFPLTTQPIFFGTGTVGQSYLNRVEISAYFASGEDINARALPAIRSTNPVLVQPLTTLFTIVR